MTASLGLLIAFLLILLGFIWWPFIKTKHTNNLPDEQLRDETNISLYHEHKQALAADLASGKLTQQEFDYHQQELDASLLEDIEQAEQQPVVMVNRLSLAWPVILTLFVLGFSVFGYQKLGAMADFVAYQTQLAQPQPTASSEAQQAMQQVLKIKQAIKANPQDSDAWYKLGQAQMLVGNFEQAIESFDQVQNIEGEKADIYGAKAQALFYKNQQQLTPDVQAMLDKALALDALDASSNILLGMNSFMQQDYQQAIDYWEKLVASGQQNVNVQALSQAINEAKQRLALTGNETSDNLTANAPELTVTVALDAQFTDYAKQHPDAVVFVYATASQGPRMPLAAIKLKASDLPKQVVLNNSQAINPQFNLASAEQVTIHAVLSKSGSAGIKAGDFQGQLAGINALTKEPLTLAIDQLVPEQGK